MSIKIKVYGLFKSEMLMPFLHENLIDLYARKETAEAAAQELNDKNENPMEEDCYGPMSGCKYFVAELDVK